MVFDSIFLCFPGSSDVVVVLVFVVVPKSLTGTWRTEGLGQSREPFWKTGLSLEHFESQFEEALEQLN